MEEKKNNNNILLGILIAIVIFGLGALSGYYYHKVTQNENKLEDNQNKPAATNDNNENQENNLTPAEEPEDYTKYTSMDWTTKENVFEDFGIEEIADGKIKFYWKMIKIDLIEEKLPWNLGFDAELPFENGKTTFYYNGYEDINHNNEDDDGEHYYRKGIVELKNDKVYINLETITKEEYENNLSLDVTDAFIGSEYFELKEYIYDNGIPYMKVDID